MKTQNQVFEVCCPALDKDYWYRVTATNKYDAVDQYESMQEVLRFLNKRCLVRSAYDCLKQVTYQYEDAYGRCERCDEPHEDCYGHDDDPYDRYDRFSDEADFG